MRQSPAPSLESVAAWQQVYRELEHAELMARAKGQVNDRVFATLISARHLSCSAPGARRHGCRSIPAACASEGLRPPPTWLAHGLEAGGPLNIIFYSARRSRGVRQRRFLL